MNSWWRCRLMHVDHGSVEDVKRGGRVIHDIVDNYSPRGFRALAISLPGRRSLWGAMRGPLIQQSGKWAPTQIADILKRPG
jgi:hypothetical protein